MAGDEWDFTAGGDFWGCEWGGMSWAVGYDTKWSRYIGYGVPAYCDEPNCYTEIDRGLSYVCCDFEPYGGDDGCGLYFCEKHRYSPDDSDVCPHVDYVAKPDHPDWVRHKLTDPSWAEWRAENSEWVRATLK